jgi:heat shock protein HslJ
MPIGPLALTRMACPESAMEAENEFVAALEAVGSSWELDGDGLTIGPPRTTLMACVEPPGVMGQEAALQLALESAARVEVAPRALTILDAEGAIVLDAVRE